MANYTSLILLCPILLFYFICNCFAATINSNMESKVQPSESLCSYQTEKHIPSDGKLSSILIDLNPGITANDVCQRNFIAPESHGFFVHLLRPKKLYTSTSHSIKSSNHMDLKVKNSNKSCPLSIYNTNDPLTPWKIDPCNLDIHRDIDEPTHLLAGRIKINWHHNLQTPGYQLLVTVLGKGSVCESNKKHPCLKFGSEKLLCISSDLICDGVWHCPRGNEYYSDESLELCSKRKLIDNDADIWENFTIEIFKNLFSSELKPFTTTITSKIDPKGVMKKSKEIHTEHKKNITRISLTNDLSRYGPWGYLMLGMLLCGGALLLCGLWECCCRQSKTSPDLDITSQNVSAVLSDSQLSSVNQSAAEGPPPNYEELDPPPSYSALFPNQKSQTNLQNISANTSNNNTT